MVLQNSVTFQNQWAPCKNHVTVNNAASFGVTLYTIMPSVCLCATELRILYDLRLSAPEVGGAWSLHATQLGAMGGVAHPAGAFSMAGARRLQAFLHYSSSHNRECGLFTIITHRLELTVVNLFIKYEVPDFIHSKDEINAPKLTTGHSNMMQSCITAARGRFNHIRQVAPICTPSSAPNRHPHCTGSASC